MYFTETKVSGTNIKSSCDKHVMIDLSGSEAVVRGPLIAQSPAPLPQSGPSVTTGEPREKTDVGSDTTASSEESPGNSVMG